MVIKGGAVMNMVAFGKKVVKFRIPILSIKSNGIKYESIVSPNTITARTTAISTYNGVSFSARFFVSVTIADIPLKKHCFPASLRISPIASIVPSEEVPSSKKIAIIVPVSELNTS